MDKKKMTFEEYFKSLREQNLDNDKIIFENLIIDQIPNVHPLNLSNQKYKPLVFNNCVFKGDFKLTGNEFSSIEIIGDCKAENIIFNKAIIKGFVYISDSSINQLQIIDVSLQQGCEIANSQIENLNINAHITKGLEILGNFKSIINRLNLTISNIFEIRLDSYNISEFIIEGKSNTGLVINKCKINRLINSALGAKSISINGIQPIKEDNSLFDFSKCEVTYLEVLNSKLYKYNELLFRDSKFERLDFVNIEWKTRVRSNIYDSIVENRFLKNNMKKQGNKVYETFFLAYELNAIRKSIAFKGSINDQVTLFFNWFSNFYRLNIWLPILWFIVVGSGFFFGIICCEGLSLTDNWGKLFVFFNPTHRLNFLGAPMQNFSLFLDFTGRIFMSYFIYQFIQAFRRHSVR